MYSGADLYPYFKKCGIVDTDTRSIRKGSIFFALKGDNFNGNAFALNAIEAGASYAVVDEKDHCLDHRFLLVENGLKALQDLAREHRKHLSIPIIGITGSNGKTTTKELLRSVLATSYKTFATYGNLNNHIGVPLSILSIDESYEFAIIEMGANHQKEIELLSDIADPDHGLITNIGKAHLEGFGGIEGVKKGKGELFDHLKKNSGHIFVNKESTALMELLNGYPASTLYGYADDCSVVGKLKSSNPFMKLEWKSHISNQTHSIQSNLTGAYNLDNVLAAICIGLHFKIDALSIKNGIESYFPDNNRSQLIDLGNYQIISDYYNANPTSMSASIEAFVNMKGDEKWLFLGDMLELGDESPLEHQTIIDKVKTFGLQNAVFVGPEFMACRSNSQYTHFNSSEEVAKWLIQNKPNEALVLIKGSRGIRMENIMHVFKSK